MLAIFALAALCVLHVEALLTGAPLNCCDNMTPRHFTGPQNSSFPYELTTTDNGDGTWGVTLTAADLTFVGLMIQTREFADPGDAPDESQPVLGTWDFTGNDGLRFVNCSFGAPQGASGVTHFNADPKESVSLTWAAGDAEITENTFVVATVVEIYETFWVNVKTRPGVDGIIF